MDPRTWGTTAEERDRAFACDRHLEDPDDAYYRGIDVDARPEVVFRWLCQLRVAPYSHDWIDNLGRRSPRSLTPGLENLEVGQRFMTIFELVEFEPDAQITLLTRRDGGAFGLVAVTYGVVRGEATGSRLLVKILIRRGRRRLRLPIGPRLELVMMRKQLRTLKQRAESPHRR
ncbi:MAG: hypothetical protein ACXWED_07320 [Solirubrobacterales bacterium]